MAIDDNTSYELTGAQVKDLANKIRGKAADNTFVGATPAAPGSKGLVPEPQAGDNTKFLSGDGTWQAVPAVNNGALTIQQNGTTIGTFSANQSTNTTINIDAFYPVGSIYMTATLPTAADVEAALGGTWVAWGAGRVPVGVDTSQTEFDTVEETGGEKTHTLTIEEMSSHNHTIVPRANFHGSSPEGHTTAWEKSNETSQNTSNTGGGQAHNNLQPYITCYMYKRTA